MFFLFDKLKNGSSQLVNQKKTAKAQRTQRMYDLLFLQPVLFPSRSLRFAFLHIYRKSP
jgi:hypothetical protein